MYIVYIYRHIDLSGYHWTDVFTLIAADDVICRYFWFCLHFHPQPWSARHSLTHIILIFLSANIGEYISLICLYFEQESKNAACPLCILINNVSILWSLGTNVFAVAANLNGQTVSLECVHAYRFILLKLIHVS